MFSLSLSLSLSLSVYEKSSTHLQAGDISDIYSTELFDYNDNS